MRGGLLLAPLVLLAACQQPVAAAPGEAAFIAPAPRAEARETPGRQTAVFAGGCFWGIEAIFSHLRGVTSVVSGYHGGAAATAHYDTVSGGRTGHAEAVRITYDPAQIRYDQLLQVFFSVGADPTLVNRQGPDEGTQYRSALIPTNPEQRRVAQAYLAQMAASGAWRAPIATRIEPYKAFYPAEAYHQDFAARNPTHGYILRWDAPKVAALKRLFPALYQPAFTRG
jgi:peptide-methionine (S)-S-oxide reductase